MTNPQTAIPSDQLVNQVLCCQTRVGLKKRPRR